MILYYDCDKCDYRKILKYLPREYKLDGDTFVGMQQRHFWCSGCNDLSVIESFDIEPYDVEFQENRLNELRAFEKLSSDEIQKLASHERFAAERATEYIAEIEQEQIDWLKWKGLRKSPSRCLKCGKVEPLVPESNMQSLHHEGCGGTLECKISITSHNGPATFSHIYNIEGELIEQGRKPKIVPGTLKAEYSPMELFIEEDSIPGVYRK